MEPENSEVSLSSCLNARRHAASSLDISAFIIIWQRRFMAGGMSIPLPMPFPPPAIMGHIGHAGICVFTGAPTAFASVGAGLGGFVAAPASAAQTTIPIKAMLAIDAITYIAFTVPLSLLLSCSPVIRQGGPEPLEANLDWTQRTPSPPLRSWMSAVF